MTNIGQLMKQAQQMQKKMQEVQAKLDNMSVEGTAGGGMINVVMTCKGEVKKITIDPNLVDKDEIEMLEDLITAALNDAKGKAQTLMDKEMAGVTGGMGLPSGMKFPF
ncbi:MAG: YbaB/EbfC family nucleoid-associated protein [Alphaproteobacteria bacterium]|nr:YbaB/EbfC family nucleoid-associated protein [Alphaproteobacteria bacterium]